MTNLFASELEPCGESCGAEDKAISISSNHPFKQKPCVASHDDDHEDPTTAREQSFKSQISLVETATCYTVLLLLNNEVCLGQVKMKEISVVLAKALHLKQDVLQSPFGRLAKSLEEVCDV